MNRIIYELIVIGGGISSCTFVSNLLAKGFKGKIAIIETGRNLGGRCSSRISKRNSGWILNHGSPNFNIINNSNDQKIIIIKGKTNLQKLENSLKKNFRLSSRKIEKDIFELKLI